MQSIVPFMVWVTCLHGAIIVAIAAVAGSLEPKFNTTEERVTVTEGSRAILPCSVEYLGEQSVIWSNPRKILISHKDRRTIDDHRISVERPYIKEWNLLIRQVRHNDSGVYECRINTTPSQVKRVILEVLVPPMILSDMSSDRVLINEGETATLICNVTGIPKPNVTWYKRNSRKPDGKKERIGTEGEVLVIHNVSRMCDDIYECFVDNGVPPAVSKAIRVSVDYPPEVQLPNRRIGQIVGKETILDCIISANPHAVSEWKRDGKTLVKSSKYDIDVYRDEYDNSMTLSLRIKNLDASDFGNYECVGSNHKGMDQEEMTLYEIIPTTTSTTTTTTTTTDPPTTRNPEYRYEDVHARYPPDSDHGHHQGNQNRAEQESPYAQSREDNSDWILGSSKEGGHSAGEGKPGDPYRGRDKTWSIKPKSDYPVNSSAICGASFVAEVMRLAAFFVITYVLKGLRMPFV